MFDFDGTIKTANEGLSIFPSSDTLNNLVGASYRELFQYDKAITYFEKAKKISKQYSHPYYNLEMIYAIHQNYPELVKTYIEHYKNLQDDKDIIKSRAEAYAIMNDFDNAIKDYEFFGKLAPDDKSVFYKLALFNFYKGNYAAALDNFSRYSSGVIKPGEYDLKDVIETLQKGKFIYPCIWGDCEYGTGVYVDDKGNIFTGTWVNGIFYYGIARYKDGSFYTGHFDGYKKYGTGCEKTAAGKINIGYFKDDAYIGKNPVAIDLSKYKTNEVFRDDFNTQDKNWIVRDPYNMLKKEYNNGKLVLSNHTKFALMMIHTGSIENSGMKDSFTVECTFTLTEYNKNSSIGMLVSSGSTFAKGSEIVYPESYEYVNMSGNYSPFVWKDRSASEYTVEPMDNYVFPLIKGKTYKMTVVINNSVLKLFINDVYLGMTKFKSMDDYIGFIISNNISVEVDYISMYTFSAAD